MDDLPIVKVVGTVSKEDMEKLYHFMKFPEMNKDVLLVLPILERAFREITGMDQALQVAQPKSQERTQRPASSRGKD